MQQMQRLARIDGSGNCVVVHSDNMGDSNCTYAGPGAGRFPTANSIIADLDRAATGTLPPGAFAVTNPSLTISSDYKADGGWYIRFGVDDTTASLVASAESLVESAASCLVPIESITVQHDGQIIVTTGPCWYSNINAFGLANAAALYMPILSL
jgi:homoserine dehydrogenase